MRRFAPPQNQILNQALQLLANGQPGEAALILDRLAHEMEAGNHPRRAANLHAQAAHAYADAHHAASTLAQSRAAMGLFLQFQMVPRAVQFYANITHKLRNKGMTAVADTLQEEFGPRVGPVPAQQSSPAMPHKGHLPVACPQCGGPIRPDEADWVDDRTIQCVYCGSLIQSD